eukprot:Amastigsp_a2803_52.p1 type:complete len:287 gc:universal Amastigsp_a2803_52:224-1084(+)
MARCDLLALVLVLALLALGAAARGAPLGGENAWNETLAYRLVRYACAAYCPREQVEDWSCKACNGNATGFVTTNYILDTHTSTHAFTGFNSEQRMILLCFAGTENLQNWAHDLEFFKVDFTYPDAPSDCRVHGGFFRAFLAVREEIHIAVTSLVAQFPDYEVMVTGHSLGGALAVFGALDLALTYNISATLISFGQPRVGNEKFSEFFGAHVASSIRVVNDTDIFPALPPRALGFYHQAREVWFHDGLITVCDNTGEDPKCSDSQIDLSTQMHHVYLGSVMGGGDC